MFPCLFPFLKNGELIYGCKDARSPMADWSELAHHLKPFFFPSNGLASGPHCTRAVIRELVRVITRVLLSGSDKGRAGALRSGPGLRGPPVCEASPFSRSLRCQGRPGGRAGRKGSRACGMACKGPAWPHGASVGAALVPSGLPKAGPPYHLSPRWGHYRSHLLSGFINCSIHWSYKILSKCRPTCLTSSVVSLHCSISLQPWRWVFLGLSFRWRELRPRILDSHSARPFRVGGWPQWVAVCR